MKIIAYQIDLARQKERIDYLKTLVDKAEKWGYNTIILYLETCIRTADTPFFNDDETYSEDEAREIVNYIESRGLTAVPAFENFYHIEKLLCYDEFADFAEFPDEKARGRGWTSPVYPRGAVGCVSNPAFNEFFDKYITEVCSLFPSGYVHMGLDEIFEFGECPRCKERIKNGETKKDFFLKQVLHNYELAKKLGKRMMMWDDFLEYYDISDAIPRDVILCHWNYGYIGSETKGHWTGRVRKDWLSVYDKLGFEYICCVWGRQTSAVYNLETMTNYAKKHEPSGMIMTEWECSDSFYLGCYPVDAYAAALWGEKAASEKDGIRIYADILGDKSIAETVFKTPIVNDCLYSLDVGKRAEDGNLVKLIAMRQTEEAVNKLREALKGAKGESKDVLLDIYDSVLERLLKMRLHALSCEVFDGYETGKTDFSEVFSKLDEIEKEFKEINSNAEYLWKKYRDGIKSSKNQFERTKEGRLDLIRAAKKQIIENTGCGVLFIDMVTPDGFSCPKIRVRVKYAGEAEETLEYDGAIKPGLVSLDAGGCHTYRIAVKNKAVDYVTITCHGEGSLFTSSLRLLTLGEKSSVSRVEKLCGRVKDENALLLPDVTFCEYGYPDGTEHLNDVSLARKESGVKIFFA